MYTESKPVYLGTDPILPPRWTNFPKYTPSCPPPTYYPGMEKMEGPFPGPYSYPMVGNKPEWKQAYPECSYPAPFWQPPTKDFGFPYTYNPEGEWYPTKPFGPMQWENKPFPYMYKPEWETKMPFPGMPFNKNYTKEMPFPYSYQPEGVVYPNKPYGAMPWESKINMPMNYYKDTPMSYNKDMPMNYYKDTPMSYNKDMPMNYKDIKEGSFPYTYRPEWFPTTYGPKTWENKTAEWFPTTYGPKPWENKTGMPYYKDLINEPNYPYIYKPEGEMYPTKPYGPNMSCPSMHCPWIEKECGPVGYPTGRFPEYKPEPNWHGECPSRYSYGYGNLPTGQRSSVLGG